MTPDPGWNEILSEAGRHSLSLATRLRASGESLDRINRALRETRDGQAGSPELIAAVISQIELRERARAKFGDLASDMLFTKAGLEQASRQAVARLHAKRYRHAGASRVVDLGCGIGSESIAMKQAGIAPLAVEIDPLSAAFADHNLSLIPGEHRVVTGDAVALAPELLTQSDGVFLDPARRTGGHRETTRLTSPDEYSPPLSFAFDVARHHATGIKLGPGFDREEIPDDAEAQWVSVDGSVVETALWYGACARSGIRRSACVVKTRTAGEASVHELQAAADSPDAPTGDLGAFVYEPDGAVIRARLIGQLADELGAHMLDPHLAYMTGDRASASPFVQEFRVLEELPFQTKSLARELRSRNIGSLEIKKRGVNVDPAMLRKQLKLRGEAHATLILMRIGERRRAILAERLAPAAD